MYLPNIFVSTVGDEVKGWKVAVYGQQIQTQQHDQNLDDDPNQGGAGTQSQNLWTEPAHSQQTIPIKLIWHKTSIKTVKKERNVHRFWIPSAIPASKM